MEEPSFIAEMEAVTSAVGDSLIRAAKFACCRSLSITAHFIGTNMRDHIILLPLPSSFKSAFFAPSTTWDMEQQSQTMSVVKSVIVSNYHLHC